MTGIDYRQAYFGQQETIEQTYSPSTRSLERTKGGLRLLERCNSFRLSCRSLKETVKQEETLEDSIQSLNWSNDSSSADFSHSFSSLSGAAAPTSFSNESHAIRLLAELQRRIETTKVQKQQLKQNIKNRLQLAQARYEGGGSASALVSMRRVQKLRFDLVRLASVESQLMELHNGILSKLERARTRALDGPIVMDLDLEDLYNTGRRVREKTKSHAFKEKSDAELLEELSESTTRPDYSHRRRSVV